jgi:flagellar assembly factor FliW
MLVNTTRFGHIEIPDERVISFPKGLLGFPDCTRFCLLEPGEECCFFWLQSLDDKDLAFVVTDPSQFFPEYSVVIREDQMSGLQMKSLEEAQVFVIVNKVMDSLTGNLQGPLVINSQNLRGEQIVLGDKRWNTRHEIMKVGGGARTSTGAFTPQIPQRPLAIPA